MELGTMHYWNLPLLPLFKNLIKYLSNSSTYILFRTKPTVLQKTKKFFGECCEYDSQIVTSVITVEEYCVFPFRNNKLELIQNFDKFLEDMELNEDTMNQIFSGYRDGYRSIYRMKNVEQINEWLAVFRDGLCEFLQSRRATYKNHVITNVQKYINSHIEERLSLNEVAAVFGLSPNYLSVLFKKTCGVGFSEYLPQGIYPVSPG